MDRQDKKRGTPRARLECPGEIIDGDGPGEGQPVCDWPGCRQAGEHKAPRSRRQMRLYHWFCLAHVRIFNKSWNYCRGMSEAEIEAAIRSDTTWNRPSWPLGSLGGSLGGAFGGGPRAGDKKNHWFGRYSDTMQDPFGFLGREEPSGRPGSRRVEPTHERALRTLDLKFPVTVEAVKARYKTLVKRHHPDVNRGDKTAEERLKRINQAYETVMNCLAS
jgi:hypothetical protein